MNIHVCKFGGSSAADAAGFMRIRRIIESDAKRRYIVLSAPGKRCESDDKITDLFYQAHDGACMGDYSILAGIFKRYASIRDALVPEFDLEAEFAKIRSNLQISRDYAASRGEYLCAKLFSTWTGIPFCDASKLILFSEDGSVDLDKSYAAIKEEILLYEKAIIPGFYGSSSNGSIQTFSRGGSDVSGALIAAGTNAVLYENWTDVDGLFTADPKIVASPARNLHVSLNQMERIAEAGAQLLHPDALKLLRNTGIDTLLKNTFRPGEEGTRISEHCNDVVRCITGKRKMYMNANAALRSDAEPVLYAFPLKGMTEVSVISVFGAKEGLTDWIEATLKPIHIIHMQDQIRIIIPCKDYESTIRCIHDRLLR